MSFGVDAAVAVPSCELEVAVLSAVVLDAEGARGLLEMMNDCEEDKEDMDRLEMFDEDSEQDVVDDEEVDEVDESEDVARWS